MEQRGSRIREELEQLKSACSSGRLMSLSKSALLDGRLYRLEVELQKAKTELHQKKVTIESENGIILKKASTPNGY